MNSTRSWKTPTPEQVTNAIALLGQAAQARYFFDRLTNPEWIQVLRDRGLFRNPAPSDRNEEKGTISFPPWPPSRFLARMASERPELVRDVFLQMDRSDNLAVYEDMVDAALRMPANLAATLARRVVEEVSGPYAPLPDKLATLMIHLAKGGEQRDALRLARYLLEPLKSKPPLAIDGRDDQRLSPDAEARISEFEYQEIVQDSYPVLTQHVGLPAFHLICDLLEEAVKITRSEKQEPPFDYSSIWRPAVEDHSQNISADLENTLVSGVRRSAEELVNADRRRLMDLVDLLERRPWHIFHRIALYLLRVFAEVDEARDAIAVRLTRRELFDASWARHEYVLLETKAFASLAPDDRTRILQWIEQGPDLEAFKRSHEEWGGKAASDSELEMYRKAWQRDRLAPIREGLPPNWSDLYTRLVGEAGEPEHPEFSSYSTTFSGPTSPRSVEEISTLSVGAVVEFLRDWRPPREHFGPTPEGLGRNLASAVKARPEQFATEAEAFRGLDPTYVRALFHGFSEATGEKRSFDWARVLALAVWVLEQPVGDRDRGARGLDRDPGWGWSRKAIAALLTAGFREEAIPFEEREHAWAVLKPLTEDPDPSPEEDASDGMDPATLSINTTRGEAMHAVIQYSLWVHRHLKTQGRDELLRAGFEGMPEVRDVLERRLQVDLEPTRAIRAVYGQWFPWLTLLDAEWARARAAEIFLSPNVSEPLWHAAWGTYIVFCAPYTSVFEILRDQYRTAIERLGPEPHERDGLRDPERRLAEHLVVYYWRGQLPLDDPLLARFWEKASPKVAAHALSYIGRSLREDKGVPDESIMERFKALWESRVAAVAAAGTERVPEAAAFGWWFVSGKFNEVWATTNLVKALDLARKVEFASRVVERLAEIAAGLPRQAVDALWVLVEDSEPWEIYAWRQSIRTVTSVALQSGDEAVRRKAEELIHGLGQRGYFDFRDLLQK